MKFKKILLNLFVFSILIGGFLFVFFDGKNVVTAESTLVLCVRQVATPDPTNVNHVKIIDGTTGSTVYLDITSYFTIDSIYVCPAGYYPFPADFNLNLLKYATSTEYYIFGTTTASTSPLTYDEIRPEDLIFSNDTLDSLYNSILNGYTGTWDNFSGSYYYIDPNTGEYVYDPNYANFFNTNPLNSYTPSDPAYTNNPLPEIYYDQNGGAYFINPSTGQPTYINNSSSGSGSFNLNYPPYNPNYNSSTTDPYYNPNNPAVNSELAKMLSTGRFHTLDPYDYPYCLNVTRDFGLGATDASTGREVTALQSYLYSRGFLDVEATGYFGNMTELALKKFQYRNNLQVTGRVNGEVRNFLTDFTCIKIPKISYEDKPLSPGPVKSYTKTTTIRETNVSTTPSAPRPTTPTEPTPPLVKDTTPPTTIPTTDSGSSSSGSVSTLSSSEGNMYLSQRNILYFMYNTRSPRPYICIDLNNTDCSNSANYGPVMEGILRNFYEVTNFSGKWGFSLYNSTIWGQPGDKAKIYIKDSQTTNAVSIYTVNILN